MLNNFSRSIVLALAAMGSSGIAMANAPGTATTGPSLDVIRKALMDGFPQIRTVEEVNQTPVNGVVEVRVNGTDLVYTDPKGLFMFQGQLVEVKSKRNLTQEKTDKLTAIKFESLPFKDAFTIVRGNGSRKLAIFEDPNCSYCKRFERDLQKVDNVTIHVFLYPILGADSMDKAKNIHCAKDSALAWQDYMVRDVPLGAAPATCDAASISRNVDYGKNFKISGTPTLIFANGKRIPGALDTAAIEKNLSEASLKPIAQ